MWSPSHSPVSIQFAWNVFPRDKIPAPCSHSASYHTTQWESLLLWPGDISSLLFWNVTERVISGSEGYCAPFGKSHHIEVVLQFHALNFALFHVITLDLELVRQGWQGDSARKGPCHPDLGTHVVGEDWLEVVHFLPLPQCLPTYTHMHACTRMEHTHNVKRESGKTETFIWRKWGFSYVSNFCYIICLGTTFVWDRMICGRLVFIVTFPGHC